MSTYYDLANQENTDARKHGSLIPLLSPSVAGDLLRMMHPAAIYRQVSNACSHYSDNLREAMTIRKQADLPRLYILIGSVLLFTLGYILLAINYVPPGRSAGFHFQNESGLITPLSSFFLAMASTFSVAALVVSIREKERNMLLWIVMTLGFAFLSFDELIQFHERTGSVIKHYADSGAFRNWNDIIVISYGFIALFIMALFLPRIMRYPMLPELLAVAFILYFIHTLVDSTTGTKSTESVILEESAKLLCVSFLAISMFVGFLGTLWNTEQPDRHASGT